MLAHEKVSPVIRMKFVFGFLLAKRAQMMRRRGIHHLSLRHMVGILESKKKVGSGQGENSEKTVDRLVFSP